MKYVGFSLHYYGECYGQTQAHFEALTGRAAGEKHHCIGDQNYNNCKVSHDECTGTHEAEYVYRMQEKAPEGMAWYSVQDFTNIVTGQECRDDGVNMFEMCISHEVEKPQ